jgi:hypothetical protein
MPLTATIHSYSEAGNNRATGRHTLRLQVTAYPASQLTPSEGGQHALIYNLSRGGLLLETVVLLNAGDVLIFDLPEVGAIAAEVVWARDGFAGCRFERPVPQAAVSAALLRSEPREQADSRSIRPPSQASWNWEFEHPAGERPFVRAVALAGLILAVIVAAAFVIALLSFPFSTG